MPPHRKAVSRCALLQNQPKLTDMTFKEIASRVTGISVPIFGISWTPPKPEKEVAEKVITFLEDRRVLYSPFELEMPEHCKISILKIRDFVTQQLFDVKRDSELANKLRAMRAACRRFLDALQANEIYFQTRDGELRSDMGMGGQMIFYSAVGEFRGTMGVLIVYILIMYGIDCEGELMKILPLTKPED